MEGPHPSLVAVEQERLLWLRHTRRQAGNVHTGMRISTQGLLLLIDVEKSFCAGAWLSVVVLSYAIVDATLRDITTGDYIAKTKELYGTDPDLEWLRSLRNQVVHVSPTGSPSAVWKLPANDLAACHAALEPEAKRAIALAYRQVHARADA
jgi:hypothetical protein